MYRPKTKTLGKMQPLNIFWFVSITGVENDFETERNMYSTYLDPENQYNMI